VNKILKIMRTTKFPLLVEIPFYNSQVGKTELDFERKFRKNRKVELPPPGKADCVRIVRATSSA